MATQFENGLTLSQLAERNAELVTEVEKLRAERDASLNEERVWEKTMMEVCGEDGPASFAAVIKALAVENVALKNVFIQKKIPSEAVDAFLETAVMEHDWNETSEWSWVENETEVIHAVLDALKPETPATDAYLAGIKADAITASLDACSDYLETDCVMDRLDISYEEAEKRTSGAIEFHDAMVNFANQMRKGAK
ncbi:dynein light chain family protein [Klebsiella pneumoniae]